MISSTALDFFSYLGGLYPAIDEPSNAFGTDDQNLITVEKYRLQSFLWSAADALVCVNRLIAVSLSGVFALRYNQAFGGKNTGGASSRFVVSV